MDMGADDFIIKPFTRSELINSVRARLEKVKAVESSLNALKEEVVASLPHEFRTPLNAVLGFSKIIQEDADKHSTEDIAEMAGHIFNSGVNLFRLSQKYLIYLDVVVRNKDFFYDEVIDLKNIIENIAREVATDHDRTNDLIANISNASLKLTDDYFRFAVRELVDNAFKFSSPGQQVEIAADRQGENYHLTINDQGIGFPDGTIKKIEAFQQFSCGQFSRSGLGLGLFLARKIIGVNQGRTEIFSVPNKGTKISVFLPLHEKKSETIDIESEQH
jgi:signal transduction histidine kinase